MIFQLYSNLFYFINAAMFNYLVLYGRELGAFHYHSGKNLRINLDLLEGWACQQGFKSVVLNYMVKLSSVVDLLCIPPDELVQVCVSTCLLTVYLPRPPPPKPRPFNPLTRRWTGLRLGRNSQFSMLHSFTLF